MVDRPLKQLAFSARERWLALGLFVLAFLLRAWLVHAYEQGHPQAATPMIDEAAYDAWARRIAAGDWRGEGIFFQEPLYSYLLGVLYWIFGASLHAARIAQALLGALTALAVLFLARRAFGKPAGWIAGFGWAIYRPALWFPSLLLKENLFAVVLALLALQLVRTRDPGRRAWTAWLLAGLLAGVGALLRGNLLPMVPFLTLWPVARAWNERRRLAPAFLHGACLVAGVFLVLLPVAVRNQVVGGELVLTTSGAGTNFYGGNNLANPYGVATEFPWVRGVPDHEADDWRHEAERRVGRRLSPVEVSDFWLAESFASMRAHPAEHARILLRKLRLTLGAHEVPDNHYLEWDARYVAPLRWTWPGFGVVGPLALAGIALAFVLRRARGRAADPAAWSDVLFVACLYAGTVVLTVTSDRIRFPLVALLFPFAAWFVVELADWVLRERPRPVRRILGGAGALALAIAVVWTPVIDAAERANDFDERDYNLAAGMLRAAGSPEAVRELVLGLQARHPESVRVELLAAELDHRRGRSLLESGPSTPELRAAAEPWFDSALGRLRGAVPRAKPQELYRIHALAGAIQQYLGQFAGAARHYATALQFDPEDRDLLRRRGVSLANAAAELPPGAERRAGLDAALALLEPLAAETGDPELVRLVGEIRAQR